jgi:integral membrane protein
VLALFRWYRVLAWIVGVLLAFCALVAFPLRHFAAEGSGPQRFGDQASILWIAHGWVFMVYVVVAFLLCRRARWSYAYTLVALIAGLVPLLIFWVERDVERRVRAQHPELVTH